VKQWSIRITGSGLQVYTAPW